MGAWDRDGSAVPRAGQSRSTPHTAVSGHNRPRLWRSVRVRILLPVLLAAAGVLVLGAVQVNDAVVQADQADRASRLARAAGAVGALAHHVALEYVLQNQAQRTGSEPPELREQEAATDQAIADFDRATQEIIAAAPALAPFADAADRAVAGIALARTVARQSPDGTAEVRAFYDEMTRAPLALANALSAQMGAERLIELSRGVVLVGELHYLAALQFDLVARGLNQRVFDVGDPLQLAELVGMERKQVQELSNLRVANRLYSDLVSEGTVASAASIRQVILDGRGTPASLALDPQDWSRAQSRRMQGLWEIEQNLALELALTADALGTAARERTYLIGGLSAAVIALTLIGATVMAARLSRRLRSTRHAALTAARVELPSAISNVIAAQDADGVRAVLADSSQRIDSILSAGPDEIGELSAAFGAVHRQALRLAADQALLRMEVQAMFVALSRRGQTLVQRQIHLIDEFGRNEADPEALERLFALDHLAARMRRNEENLLVLAGGEPGRWITRPVALVDLLRAAAQEIEEYRRVEVGDVPSVAVTAHVAGDAIHLLAELLENATSFSPPSSRVRVSAGRTVGGLAISVVDSGIGMPEFRLGEANERLSRPSTLTSSLVGTMGLLVVARLAQRHGIQVRLRSAPAVGTTAMVTLPERLVVPLSMVDQLQPGRWVREIGSGQIHPPVAAAVTSLPITLPPAGARPHPVGQAPTADAGHGVVGQPGLGQPVVGSSMVGQPGGAGTHVPMPRAPLPLEAGADSTADLPRSPGEDPMPPAQGPTAMTPDPEAVRARLSSLAHGIAAARQGAAPPPSVPQSR